MKNKNGIQQKVECHFLNLVSIKMLLREFVLYIIKYQNPYSTTLHQHNYIFYNQLFHVNK